MLLQPQGGTAVATLRLVDDCKQHRENTFLSADVAVELDPIRLVCRARAGPRGRVELVVPDVLARVAGVCGWSVCGRLTTAGGIGGVRAGGRKKCGGCDRSGSGTEREYYVENWSAAPGQAFMSNVANTAAAAALGNGTGEQQETGKNTAYIHRRERTKK